MTDADGNAKNCVPSRNTCPIMHVYVYDLDGGRLDIVNIFGAGCGQPWSSDWRMPAGDSKASFNCFNVAVEDRPG